jgi:hypothetical protein
MSPLSKSLKVLALENLDARTCACGGMKIRGLPFCQGCIHALPPNLRKVQYVTNSDGFAGLWDEARDFLRIEAGRIKP